MVIDQRDPKKPPKTGYHGQRSLKTVDAVVVHQTGVVMSEKTTAESVRRFPYHVVILPSGVAVLNHPFERVTWHGNSFNKRSIGLAFCGQFLGVEGLPKTCPPPAVAKPSMFTSAMQTGFVFAWSAIINELPDLPMVYAHRQSSNMRRADPGSAIWQMCIATDRTDPARKVGTGLTIPREWDAEHGVGRY